MNYPHSDQHPVFPRLHDPERPAVRLKDSLEDYLADCFAEGVIDHALRAAVDADGVVSFYIHPASSSGKTLDFVVAGNTLRANPDVNPEC